MLVKRSFLLLLVSLAAVSFSGCQGIGITGVDGTLVWGGAGWIVIFNDGSQMPAKAPSAPGGNDPIVINGQDVNPGGSVQIGDGGVLDLDFTEWIKRYNPPLPGLYRIEVERGGQIICACNCLKLICQPTQSGDHIVRFYWNGGKGMIVRTIVVVIGNPNPDPVTGACCYSYGICVGPVKQSDCYGLSWTAGASCAPNPCVTPPVFGSCCFANGDCRPLEQDTCQAQGGVWTQGRACTPNPCPQPPPQGSCCLPDGTCWVTIQSGCAGVWSVGQNCTPNPCPQPPPIAKCCVSGSCYLKTQAECNSLGGTWTAGADCQGIACPALPPPSGSCCLPNGNCSVTTQTNCAGTWTQGWDCDPNPCSQPVQLVAAIVSVTPAGGNYSLTNPVTTLTFQVKVNITGGDGRTLLVHCLPYNTTGNGTSVDIQFSATNGDHIINVPVKLAAVTNAGNNYFWVYEGQNQISASRTVTITVH